MRAAVLRGGRFVETDVPEPVPGPARAAPAEGTGAVVVSEPSPRRRELAGRFGAHVVVDPGVRDPFDAWRDAASRGQSLTVLECSGRPGMLNTVLHRAPRSTRVLLIGACMTEDVFRPVVGIYKDITVTMCMAYPPEEFAGTLRRIAQGTVDAAFTMLTAPDDHVKVLVRP